MNDAANKPPSIKKAIKPVTEQQDASDQAWQDKQTRKAVEEADAGDFATAEELKATIDKFVPNA